MNWLHNIIEKSLLLAFTFCFAFVLVYVPQDFTKIKTVEGGGGAPCYTTAGPCSSVVTDVATKATSFSTAASVPTNLTTSIQTTGSFIIDNVLDGIAWSLAKNVLSQMTSSIVNWVNSGFEGSPAFITDFKGFVTQIADEQFGQYLEELGGAFSFICAPFKLDVRLALAVTYDYQRMNGQAPGKSTACTLSGALNNIGGFIDGTADFIDNGGWESFFAISQNPNALTPLGGIFSAQAEVSARIVNARGEEFKLLDYGSGFLSSKVCEVVQGAGSDRKNCTITTPGKVINEALTFQTSTGPQSLISADEINEIVSALFAQVTQQAFTGAAGLLGLTGGSGYVYNGVPYTTQVSQAAPSLSPAVLQTLITDAIAIETEYLALINLYKPQFQTFLLNTNNSPERLAEAQEIIDEMDLTLVRIQTNIGDPNNPDPLSLNGLLAEFNAMANSTAGINPNTMQDITNDLMNNRNLHSDPEVEGKEILWSGFLSY